MDGERVSRLGDMETKRQIAQLERLREEDNFLAYVDTFVSIISQMELPDEDHIAMNVKG